MPSAFFPILRTLALLSSFGYAAFAAAQSVTPSEASIIATLRQRHYSDALQQCEAFLQSNPNSFKVWTLKAVALQSEDRAEEAVGSYRQALKLSPDYLPALEGAAQIEYKLKPQDADKLLRHIVALQPANKTAHAMLGALEYKNKAYEQAVEDFDQAGEVAASQPTALMAYAISLVHLNREKDAIPLFQKLLASDPNNNSARYDLALLQGRNSDAETALATLTPLLQRSSPDTRAMRLAASLHESRNETPQAIDLLRSAILANPDEEANYLDFATLAFAHGSYAVGVDMVTAGLSRKPQSADLLMARGVLNGQLSNFEKAMDDFESARKLDPMHSMAASAEGIAQSQKHNQAAAIDKFRQQVREHPKDALGYYLLAESLSWSSPESNGGATAANTIKEAMANDVKATQLDPHLVQAWDLLASLYLQDEQPSESARASRTALAIQSDDQSALYSLILALRKTGSKEEIKQLVEKLTDLREADQVAMSKQNRYGLLVEAP